MSDPDAPRWASDEPAPGALMMATPQLLELACAVRGSRWRDQLAAALIAAQTGGWDWRRRGMAACRLIFDPEGEPESLTIASRSPVKREAHPSSPTPEWQEARLRLEQARTPR